ncbi:cation transporter [Caldimicrobium thiodismutans]|uniref:Cation transporter n=1 Tax=Caldimicrobium thiodismutans TaxID=1653476 RepID=A0A0U5AIS1_9BACT|nr:cation-translocating P-type ATPase [Caldimicrobium thiodismutans]BAU23811.1 cation transporter [Caldimicrobium thiodismutans]
MERVTLKVEGMTCVNCAKAIEISLQKLKGVKRVEVSFELGRVSVDFEEEFLSLEEIKKVIEDLGYKVASGVKKKDYQREILGFSFLASLAIMGLMFYHHPVSLFLQALLSISIQIIGGYRFYKGAYASLRAGIGNMDVLVALGTTSALIYSLLAVFKFLPGEPFFETNAFLIAFVRLGKYIEERSRTRALNLLKELFAIQTAKVIILTPDGEKEVSVSEVLPGDILIVKPGDLIPLDSLVEEGSLEVDESLITGESVPVLKKKGDALISGSLVVNGFAKAKVSALLERSYISMLLNLVEEALRHKPGIQRIADLVAHYFVQAIVLLSIGIFFFWFFRGEGIVTSFNFALSVLVISCPCAFGLAVPLGISIGLTRAFRRGLLVKDPSVFEKAKEIKVLILDKTGTLTEGKPHIVDFKVYEEGALSLALALAQTSKHPYSRAIVEFTREKGIHPAEIGECREEPGRGIFCGEFFLGRDEFARGLVLKRGEKVLAEFWAEDKIRESTREILDYIRGLGIEPVLATGDTPERARGVAQALGIERVYAGVRPQDKLRLIEEEQSRGVKVAMVGDGINDAPALAKADLSFVMAEGVDLSKRIGDVVLISGLKGIQAFFEIAFLLRRRIFQNLFWAFIYNLIGIPIAGGLLYSYGIVLKPEIAGLMMAFSSVSVVLNSIRK